MGERIDHKEIRVLMARPQGFGGICDRLQGRCESRVESLVPFGPQPPGPHSASEKVKSEVEVARVPSIKREKRQCRGAQSLAGLGGTRYRVAYPFAKVGKRGLQHLGIDRLLGVEVEIKRGRSVSRLSSDSSQRRPLEALALENLSCSF